VKFSQAYVLFCHITTNVPADKHQDLLEAKGGQGFPHIVFLDGAGNVLAEHQGSRDAEGFSRTGGKAKSFLDVRAKAEKGDKAAEIDYALAQLELGQIKAAEATERLKGRKLTKEQQAKLDTLAAAAEMQEIMATITPEPETQTAAAKKFLEMKKAGKPAPEDDQLFQVYWILMMNLAESQREVALFEECLTALKGRFGKLPQAAAFLKAKDEALKKLKEGAPK